MTLSAKRARFVAEYLIDLNGKQAAIRAGYSPKTANEQASRLLTNVHVAEAVAQAQSNRSERTGITQDRVLQELAKLGFYDIRKAVKWGDRPELNGDGEMVYPVELIDSESIDDDTAAAVSEVSLTSQGVKIKMADKLVALEKIGKHLGMFTDKIDHTSSDGTMTPKPSINLDALTDDELEQLERITDKARDPEAEG